MFPRNPSQRFARRCPPNRQQFSASQRELMAMSGHSTSGMADHYVRGAEQERLARQAVNAIELLQMDLDKDTATQSTVSS